MNTRKQREVRSWLMFGTALLLTCNEAILQKAERPFLLTLFGSMMGLPLLLRTDEKKETKTKEAPETPELTFEQKWAELRKLIGKEEP